MGRKRAGGRRRVRRARGDRWIQKAVKRPGRVRRYLRRLYGEKAFTKSGEIKQQYLYKAKRHVQQSKMPKDRKRSLTSAINLAIRFEKMRRDKK